VAFLRTQDEIPHLFVIASPSSPPLRARCSSGTDCWDLLPTRRPVAASTEEAGQAEQVAEVVPSTVVVDLVDTEVAFEQRGHKYERRNKALPEPKPEACNHVVFASRAFRLDSSWSTSSQHEQQQDKHSKVKEDFIAIAPLPMVTKHGHEKSQNDRQIPPTRF